MPLPVPFIIYIYIHILDRYLLQHQKTKITPDRKCGWKTTIPFEMVPFQRHVLIFGHVRFSLCGACVLKRLLKE